MIKSEETKRLRTLRKYEILDTPPDGNFDKITSLVSKLFNMPIAIISLVDEDRIWFKSKYGLNVEQIGRDPGLCASAIMSDKVYIVENAKKDPRTLTNPLVTGKMNLRFYAAAPLRTQDGYNLGTLCIIDKKQRYLNSEQKQMLEDFAGITMDEMELRLAALNQNRSMQKKINELENEINKLKGKKQ